MTKKVWLDNLKPHMIKSNSIAARQIFVTLTLYIGIWCLYIETIDFSKWLIIPFAAIMALFIVRFFVLMHDCGHDALFDSARTNSLVGYVLGVITGMPQFVWSKHHAHHHMTNGNWEKYRGPLCIITTDEYEKLTPSKKWQYRFVRNPFVFVFLGGFLYVLFNPRFNWFVGLVKLSLNVMFTALFRSPRKALAMIKECKSSKWKSAKEFRHMTYNNVALLTIWYFMIQATGAFNFFSVYILSISLAGGIGILFFTVQHNFEDSYAADTASVDYIRAALNGTSYLKLPSILNWFTADIGYHHIHHLSTSIPNYRLASCHRAFEDKFEGVKRIHMSEITHSIKYLLWDRKEKILVSV